MFSRKLAALAAASLIVATTPAMAQPAAQSLSVAQSARAGAEVKGENDLAGGGFWAIILGVALVAALVLVVIDDDNADLPTSP
ncbi:MAG TPA: hypothetical protein VM120_27900 [Bryobacteraceae bacterium]|nr:hypothetical protein [Bryobacteraceae bacterium]